RLRALEARARVERHALDATVQIHAAARALAACFDRQREQVPAARTAEHLVRAHQVRRLRTACALQLTAGSARLGRLRRRFLALLAIARIVHVAALTVFALAHWMLFCHIAPRTSAVLALLCVAAGLSARQVPPAVSNGPGPQPMSLVQLAELPR